MLQPILGFFIKKENATKFAGLQTLIVTCTCVLKKRILRGGCFFFFFSTSCNL